MKVYLDASIVLRWMLQQPGRIERWGFWERAVTSALMRIEVRRTLDRMRLKGRIADSDLANQTIFLRTLTARFEEIELQPAVLERAASPLPTELGTLDAIHLASAVLWMEDHGEPLTFLTHDRQLGIAAAACGLDVLPRPAGLLP